MEKRTLSVRLYPDGRIESETHGVKGKECLQYMVLLEEMLRARIEDSRFTKEYFETESDGYVQHTQEVKS